MDVHGHLRNEDGIDVQLLFVEANAWVESLGLNEEFNKNVQFQTSKTNIKKLFQRF